MKTHHRLAPGEAKAVWLSGGDTLEVHEVEGAKADYAETANEIYPRSASDRNFAEHAPQQHADHGAAGHAHK